MKIYIGRYRNAIRTYKWFSKLEEKGYISEKTVDILTDITQPILDWCWNYPLGKYKDPYRYIKIHNYDTWNMDNTLAHIILPMLKNLKEQKQGSPYVDDEDVPENLRSTSIEPLTEQQKNTGEVDQLHHKRWEWVLDEMIWAFEQKLIDWEDQYHTGVIDFKFVPSQENTNLLEMQKGHNHTHKLDMDGMMKHQKKISNGFRLFGKYYEGLWS